ncbi:MAG TPA: hypothetical protein VLB27_04510, partial [candidate division Zixibacteria bacterium]|nr:hypothetical protein [candidate division Zixibacteria bacterium]
MDAGGSITDANSDETANVSGARARLVSGGSIGSGAGTESDTNAGAVDISVTSVEAQATGDIYLESGQAVTVGGVGDVATDYERFDSGTTMVTDTDLTGLAGTGGVVKLKSAGTVTVNEAVQAGTDVLLLTTAGDITQNVQLTVGTGNLSVIAADSVSQNADLTAGSDAYVEAGSGSITMAAGTQTSAGDDIRYAAGSDIALGLLAGTESVSVDAGGNITDANSDETANVSGARARLVSGGSIGSGAGAESDTNTGAVDISVTSVEAQATDDIYLESGQAVTVGGVGDVLTDYERFDSGTTTVTDTDLTVLEGTGGVVKLKSAGTITVDEAVQAGTDVLLLATTGDITQDADLKADAGNLSVIAAGSVSQNADLTAGSDAYVEAGSGSVTMAAGTQTSAGDDIRYGAVTTVSLGLLAGTESV